VVATRLTRGSETRVICRFCSSEYAVVARLIIAEFRSLGYEVFPETANAMDCGVPQSRDRTFFVGFREADRVDGVFLPIGAESYITVDMAISDLPQIASGEGSEEQAYSAPPQNAYQEWAREGVIRRAQPCCDEAYKKAH